MISQGRAGKNEADSHGNSREREFPSLSALEISLVSKLPSTNWLRTIVSFFLRVHKPIVPGQISSVDKHSSAVVMFASKHRGPMSLAEVTLKILLVCKLPSTTCLQAIDRLFLQVHKLDVPREAPWVSKQGRAVDILAH